MKNPVLIDKQLNLRAVLHPSSMNVTLKAEQTSSVSMVLPETEADVKVGDWMRIYTIQGDAGVFVVRSVSTDIITRSRTVALDHAFALLNRYIYFGKYNEDQQNKSAKTVINTFLNKQVGDVWQLGTIEFTDSEPWTFSNSSILNAINTVRQSLEDSQITFDMSSLPFTFNVIKRPTTATCEMRLNRNISTINMTVDTSRMYTRLYPSGKEDKTIDGKYVEKNTDLYGVISKAENNNSIADESHLKRWAKKRLERHCEPMVTVKVTGRELSDLTGEPFDKLTVGTVCQVPLNQFGTVVSERIDTITFSDCISKPEQVTVTLSNSRDDVASVSTASGKMAEHEARIGGGARATAEAEKAMRTYIHTTDELITLHSEYIGEMQDKVAEINVNWDKITSTVTKYGKTDLGNWIEGAQTKMEQTADRVSVVVSDGGNVRAAVIVDAINNGSVKIKASKVDIDAYFATTSGTLHVKRNLGVSKDLSVGGYSSLSGGATLGGNINSTVNIKGKKTKWTKLNVNDTSYWVLTGESDG